MGNTDQSECLVSEIPHHISTGSYMHDDQIIAVKLGAVMRWVHHFLLGLLLSLTTYKSGAKKERERDRRERKREMEGGRKNRR